MSPTHTVTYRIHLPTGKVITAKDGHDLDKIILMPVCAIFDGCQIRIEPVYTQLPPRTQAIENKEHRQMWDNFTDLMLGYRRSKTDTNKG